MTIYFSATTCSFYDTDIIDISQMPEDKVAVSADDYKSLLAAQNSGKVIIAGADGNPTTMQQSCTPCDCLVHDKVIASTTNLGHIKVDGTDITVDENGYLDLPGVVHIDGEETITGYKTFDTTINQLDFLNTSATDKKIKGFIKRTATDFKIGIQENAPTGAMLKAIEISKNGIYATKGNATEDQGSEEIATKGFVNSPNFSLNVVHRSGEETITGVKTYEASPLVPTAAETSNDKTAANTAFVKSAVETKEETLLMLIKEKDFEIDCLGKMMELDLSKLFIQVFEDTTAIDTTKGDGAYCLANYYDADKHIFIKNDTTTRTIYSIVKTVTTGNNKAWAIADWTNVENGSLKLEISRNGGTNWTTLTPDVLTDISAQPAGTSMILRVTESGKMTLKNIAWGMKS